MNGIELAEILNKCCMAHSKMLADGSATADGIYLYFESAQGGDLALGGTLYRLLFFSALKRLYCSQY